MAIRQSFLAFSGTCMLLIFSGCVSLSIGPKGPEKSREVKFEAPGAPFEALNATQADRAWQNRDNGNTISYLSSCNDPADPSLESAAREMTAELQGANTLSSEFTHSNGREALDMDVEGRVEGVPTRVRTFIFKKNGCLYTLSYVGVSKNFALNKGDFEKFVKEFTVQ